MRVVPFVTSGLLLPSVIQRVRVFYSSSPIDDPINLPARNTKVVELFQEETPAIGSCRHRHRTN
jgi:hypothetical protein